MCAIAQTKASIATTLRTKPPRCQLYPAAAALQLKAQDPKLGKQCSLIQTSLDKVYPLLRDSNGRLVPLQEEVEAALKVWLQSRREVWTPQLCASSCTFQIHPSTGCMQCRCGCL